MEYHEEFLMTDFTSASDDDIRASGYSLLQEQVLAIAPKISSSISIPCSCFIIYEVLNEHYQRRGTTSVQRTLLAMSCVDIAASSAWFMSTWAVPKESGFAFAAGNLTTCNFQGFLLQLAIGAPLYNSSLALLYLLMIKMRWTDDQLARVERWIHVFILAWTVGTSCLLLPLGQYNHIGAVCWVIGAPAGCENSSYQANPDVPCERGNYAWAWGLGTFYGPLWICVLGCCTSMALLYSEVRNTHRRSQQYSRRIVGLDQVVDGGTLHQRSRADTQRVAVQAVLYSLTFVITWLPSTLWSIAHWFNWGHYSLDLAAAIAEPLQGFWNVLIFLKSRPRTVAKIRQTLQRSASMFSFSPSIARGGVSITSSIQNSMNRSKHQHKQKPMDPMEPAKDDNTVTKPNESMVRISVNNNNNQHSMMDLDLGPVMIDSSDVPTQHTATGETADSHFFDVVPEEEEQQQQQLSAEDDSSLLMTRRMMMPLEDVGDNDDNADDDYEASLSELIESEVSHDETNFEEMLMEISQSTIRIERPKRNHNKNPFRKSRKPGIHDSIVEETEDDECDATTRVVGQQRRRRQKGGADDDTTDTIPTADTPPSFPKPIPGFQRSKTTSSPRSRKRPPPVRRNKSGDSLPLLTGFQRSMTSPTTRNDRSNYKLDQPAKSNVAIARSNRRIPRNKRRATAADNLQNQNQPGPTVSQVESRPERTPQQEDGQTKYQPIQPREIQLPGQDSTSSSLLLPPPAPAVSNDTGHLPKNQENKIFEC